MAYNIHEQGHEEISLPVWVAAALARGSVALTRAINGEEDNLNHHGLEMEVIRDAVIYFAKAILSVEVGRELEKTNPELVERVRKGGLQ